MHTPSPGPFLAARHFQGWGEVISCCLVQSKVLSFNGADHEQPSCCDVLSSLWWNPVAYANDLSRALSRMRGSWSSHKQTRPCSVTSCVLVFGGHSDASLRFLSRGCKAQQAAQHSSLCGRCRGLWSCSSKQQEAQAKEGGPSAEMEARSYSLRCIAPC